MVLSLPSSSIARWAFRRIVGSGSRPSVGQPSLNTCSSPTERRVAPPPPKKTIRSSDSSPSASASPRTQLAGAPTAQVCGETCPIPLNVTTLSLSRPSIAVAAIASEGCSCRTIGAAAHLAASDRTMVSFARMSHRPRGLARIASRWSVLRQKRMKASRLRARSLDANQMTQLSSLKIAAAAQFS